MGLREVKFLSRNNKIVSTLESNNIHQLKQLREDHSWQVFAKHAVQDDNSYLNSELKKIGMKIVEKCQGLPLALETVGGLLQSKSSVSEWEDVLRSNIWDLPIEDSKIIPIKVYSTSMISYQGHSFSSQLHQP